VRQYGCDVAYTPMIIADSFLKSQKARDADFTTNDGQLLYCVVTGFIFG